MTSSNEAIKDYDRHVLSPQRSVPTVKKPVGRGGSLLCLKCRTAKKGYNCIPDPDNLNGACLPCKRRGISPEECGERTYPEKKAKQKQNRNNVEQPPPIPSSIGLGSAMNYGPHSSFVPQSITASSYNSTAYQTLPYHPQFSASETAPNDFLFQTFSGTEPLVFGTNLNTINDQEIIYRHPHPDAMTIVDHLLFAQIVDLNPILAYLQKYFQVRSRHLRISGFRAGMVRLLGDDTGWPVVEWREGYDTDVLAIFKVLGEGTACSCLMHYGDGIGWQGRKRWRRSQLTWQVPEIADLKDLFIVAQHALGMLHWSDEDIVNLYHQDSPSNCSEEECETTLVEHAKCLITQLLQIKQVKTLFEKVSPIVQKLSSRVVIQGENDRRHCMLRGSLEL